MDLFKTAGSKVDEPFVKSINKVRRNREISICVAIEASEPCASRKIAHQINMSGRTVANILEEMFIKTLYDSKFVKS